MDMAVVVMVSRGGRSSRGDGFQGRPFNITVIQVCALTSNAEEAEVEEFYEDLKTFYNYHPRKMSFSL